MAIIKILKSSKSFSAVTYNENRVKNGEADLIGAYNFIIPENNSKNFISYLNLWSASNTRIKNPQLHVVISLKGKVEDNNELLYIAQEWLNRMGYGDNPYLIYRHNNTNNTHIHIVTTRIDQYGNKINHNFERLRSQQILNEINNVNQVKELRIFVADLLHFSFSTKNQFQELCKLSGIQTSIHDSSLKLEKNGATIIIPTELLDFCSRRYRINISDKQKKSIQAMIYKYAKQLNKDDFCLYIKKAFGLQFIFYGKENSFYGFTVVDYNNRAIYKGSEIFSIKTINELLNGKDKSSSLKIDLIVKDLIKDNKYIDINELNNKIIAQNIYTDGTRVYSLIDNNFICPINKRYSNILIYNTRVNTILRDYSPVTLEEKLLLSKIYHIKYDDLNRPISGIQYHDISYYKNMIQDIINSGGSLKESLNLYGIELHAVNDKFIFRDPINKTVVSSDRLGISNNSIEQAIKTYQKEFDFGQQYEDEYVGVDNDYEPEILIFDAIAGILQIRAGGSGLFKKKRK